MVETSTLTSFQELKNRLGTEHPQRQVLLLLNRIEKLEGVINEPAEPEEPEELVVKKKGGRPKGSKNKK